MDTMTANPETQTPTVQDPATPAPTDAKKSRGRPRLSTSETPKLTTSETRQQKETPQQKIERLQAELQKAHEAKKIADERRDSVVGSVVVRHAQINQDFHRQIAALLRTEVKKPSDLAAIAELLIEP